MAPKRRIGRNCSAGGDADRHAGAGELHDEPHLGHDLHPVADQRDDLAGEEAPVVGDRERGEGSPRAASSAPSSCSSSCSSSTAARWRVARSSAGSARRRSARKTSLRERLCRSSVRPGGRIGSATERRSASAARSISSSASSRAMIFVALGRWMRSRAPRRTASAVRGARPSPARRSGSGSARCPPHAAGAERCAPAPGAAGRPGRTSLKVVSIANYLSKPTTPT